MTYKVEKTEDEWRAELGPVQYKILREAATERPWSGALLDEKRPGTYTCGACHAPLFKSGAKFESGSGWPSFYEAISPDAVELKSDKTHHPVRLVGLQLDGSGWPSFYEAISPDAVELKSDKTHGMVRTEILCANCGSHLGHLFDDAYQTPTGDRYCMNSLSLEFSQE